MSTVIRRLHQNWQRGSAWAQRFEALPVEGLNNLATARPNGRNPNVFSRLHSYHSSTRVPDSIFEEQTLHSKQELLSLECFAAATHSLDQIITRITNNGYTCCSATKALSLKNEPSFNLDGFFFATSILQHLLIMLALTQWFAQQKTRFLQNGMVD